MGHCSCEKVYIDELWLMVYALGDKTTRLEEELNT